MNLLHSTRTRIALGLLGLAMASAPVASAATASSAPVVPSAAAKTSGGTFFNPVTSCRVFDSRVDSLASYPPPPGPRPLQPGSYDIPIEGKCTIPTGAAVVAVNVTVTGATSPGHLVLYTPGATLPGGLSLSRPSTINFTPGETRANNALVELSASGEISVSVELAGGVGQVDVVLDVSGFYADSGLTLVPMSPCRLFDSRADSPGPLDAGTATVFQVANPTPSAPCFLPMETKAVALNVTVTQPTADGHLVLYAGNTEPANTSTLNFKAGETVANNAVAELAADGSITIQIHTPGHTAGADTAHLILDVVGSFEDSVPDAKVDMYDALTNTTLSVNAASGVTSNDTLNGATIVSYGASTGAEQTTISTATPTSASGTVTLNADGSFTYAPPTDFVGNDTFKYILQNSAGTATGTVTIGVGKTAQTISFTSTAPAGATVGGPTYDVTATATSGLTVALTIDASASSVCSIAGSTVSFIGAGTCVIDANQAGDTTYSAAPQVQQSFAVGKGDQTISFTSTAPAGAMVGGPTYNVTATATSSLTVALTIDASASSVCSIAGSTVSFLSVGTCVIDANQAGDANYNAATQVQQSFAVGKGDQTVTFTSTAPAGATVGGPTYNVTATATSGLTVALTIDASASSVCSISGSTVSFLSTGTCVIDGNQAGDANYNAATQAQQSFSVGKSSQTITFTSTAPAGAKVGGPNYNVTATADSGLTVALTIDASASAVCSISGSTVSFIGAGTCVIDANQAGDANYSAAPQVQQSFAVGKGDQTITFTSTAPVGAKVGGPTYNVTATADSGLTVALTIDASASSVCTISGSTVSFIGVGTCVIDANQAGDANYNAATQVQQSFPVAKGDQTISFTSTAPVGAKVGGPTYNVTATATSGLTVTLTIDASASSVCSISGSTVSFIGAGTCVIDANQAGDANYNAATQVQQSFAVAKGDQTISFTSSAPVGAKVGGPTYNVTATATSGLTVALTIDASASSVCSISGSTVSFIGGGICVIDANQAGNANYNAAIQVQQSFMVAKNDQTITFTSTPPANATVGGPTYTVAATASSGLTVVFTIDASASSVCSISGSTVSFIGGGTCVIDANQAGDASYNTAPQVQQSFHVNQPPTPVASPKETFDTVGNTTFEFKAAQSLFPGVWVAGNLKDNFTDSDGPSPLTVVAIVAGATTNGGKVDLANTGEFTYTPKAGDTALSDSFSYQVTDGIATVTRTVTINLKSRVWYVKNDAPGGGQGRSGDPFNTLAAAQAPSLAGDYIFVYGGDLTTTGQASGIVLKANQKLYGEVFGLTVNTTVNGVANPALVAANTANRPKVTNTAAGGKGVTVTDVSGVEIRGLDIAGNTNAVLVSTSATNSGGATITDDVISGAGVEGLKITSGGSGTLTVTAQNNTVTATGNGIDARSTAGALRLALDNNTGILSNANGILIDGSGGGTTTITSFSGNTIHPNTVGTGITITSATFDAVPGGTFQTVSGGNTQIGTSGNGVGGAGFVMTTVSGDLSFADLNIVADNGAGLRASGTGAFTGSAGFQIAVSNGGLSRTVAATGGPAVDVSNATINLPLQQITSTNSSTTGVSLDTVGGTFSAGSSSSITSSTGTDFNINAGSAAVTYDGTITDTTGRLVSVTSTTGGTKSFTGAISDTSSGTGTGIFLNSNTGATINFSGALTLSTGSNAAFTATGGGTVTATATTSTATTTTGTAVNVQNTTIGASGLKFRNVSAGTAASGPTNGIVLNNTGASGGLTVAGTGGAGTGGTIQKTTGDGVSLTSTLSPSFTNLTIKDTAGHGVKGMLVTNFSYINGSIDNSGTGLGAETANIAFNTTAAGTENNLSGTVTITGNSLTNAFYHGVDIFNFNGTISDAVISNNTITSTNSTATSKGSGIRLVAFGSATTVANVTKATIANNVISNFPSANGILASGGNGNAAGPAGVFGTAGSATNIIAITGNRVAGFSAANRIGAFGIAASVNGKGQGNFDISSNGTVANPLTNMIGAAISTSSLGQAIVTSNITNNVIVANNQAGAQGIGAGTSQTFGASDTPSLTVTIANNQVSQTDGNGILVTARDATGTVRAKIQNNTVAAPLSGNRNGIRIDAGNSVSVNDSVCLNISGNTSAGVGLSPEGIGLRKQGTVAATNNFALHGFATSPANQSQTAAYVTSQNPGSASGTLIISGDNFNSPTCSFP
jgi:Big-like domain-containing protein